MTDAKLAEWLESTGFPQAAEAASRLRDLNIELEKFRKTASLVEPPKRWPHLGQISDPAPDLTHKPHRAKKV